MVGDALSVEPCVDQTPNLGPHTLVGSERGCQLSEEGADAHTAFPWQGSLSWLFSEILSSPSQGISWGSFKVP